ncbi:hypothetical protein [Crocosphaera sp.]|uniref:calcium-binding protein n=1 Tax=Crocosphaera sp. TaxID=2729996 RepID=UPI0026048927|nr:hypothetical protein [Crocosphaera sp.]MDJ0579956.1 hypothetical protein [Crocosphaera sp.]
MKDGNGLEEEEEEEEGNGNYGKTHVGKNDNSISGLKASWKESQGVESWLDGEHYLTSNIRVLFSVGAVETVNDFYERIEDVNIIKQFKEKFTNVILTRYNELNIRVTRSVSEALDNQNLPDVYHRYMSTEQLVTSILGVDKYFLRELYDADSSENNKNFHDFIENLRLKLDNALSLPNFTFKATFNFDDKVLLISTANTENINGLVLSSDIKEPNNISEQDAELLGKNFSVYKVAKIDEDNKIVGDQYHITSASTSSSTFRLADTGLKWDVFIELIKNSNTHLIADSLKKYTRNEAFGYTDIFEGIQNKRSGYEIIYDAVTSQRKLPEKKQYNSHSINHILADSAIASILHQLAGKAINNQWNDETIEQNVKPFLEALDNQSFNYVDESNSDKSYAHGNDNDTFSNRALQVFKDAVLGLIFDKDKLYEAIHTISYAPGNIRWGDRSTNTRISNFFDPIFKLDGDTIQLDESSQAIYNAVDELKNNNLITPEQFDLATKLAGSEKDDANNGTVLTSSKIIGLNDSEYVLNIEFENIDDNNNGDMNDEDNSIRQITIDGETYFFDNNLTQFLKNNKRNEDSSIKEPSSGIDKATKRIDYEIINNSTNEAGDQLTIYRIIDPNGGEPLYRVQIDIEGNKSQRISIFSSENPIQADGSIRLPETTTIISHGEKLEGTYTSTLENHYLGPDDQYLRIGANDFRNIENIETAEYQAANSENNLYLLTKYRGEDEGLGIDTSKNQEQILLTTLRDRTANDKPNIGYVTVGKHTQVTSQQAEAALSRFGTTTIISGYCRACATVDNAETYRAKLKDSAIYTHYDGIEDFVYNIKQTIQDVAQTRQTDLEGRRSSTVEKLIQQGQTIGGNIEQKSFSIDSQLPFPDFESNKIDTSGNLQVQVGDGEFTAAFWGNTNIGIKVGDGGFKAAAFGDNNIFVHIGDGDTAKYTQTIGNYNAFEGAQLFIGQRNVSFNYGVSNDFIVMLDQSIPLPPFQSPFSGPTDIVSYLKEDIAQFNVSGDSNDIDPLTGDPIEDNYYDSQNYLWSQGNAQQIIEQISSLDQNSSVEYDTVFDYGSESDRNIRALQADTERALNKGFNRVLAGGSPFKEAQGTPLKDQNFNLTIAGQGADIILTNGDNQFMFTDNIPSLLDTTIASVFGIVSQETNDENGQVGNTLSYDPRNALGNLLNQLIARVSASLPDLTLGEALGLTYDAQGIAIDRLVRTHKLYFKATGNRQQATEKCPNSLGDCYNITTTDAQRLTQEDLDSIREAFAQFVSQNAQKAGLDLKDEETGANFDITNPRHLLGLFEAFGNGNLSKFIDPDGLVDSLKSALDIGEDALNTFRDRFTGEEETIATPPATETPETDNATPPAVPVVESSEVFGFGGLTLPSVFDIDIPQLFSTKTLDDMIGLVNGFEGDIETMQEQMFDFFANSGYMTGDGDLLVSLGNNNFTWGGDGNDLVGLMGLNNNFWGGDGDDLYYGMGENNQGSGNKGDDTAVLIGINNLFFGGEGHDFALAAGSYANLSGGEGDDTLYVLGSDSWLNGGDGEDYLVAVGNYNAVVSGEGNDYVVSIGNYGDVESGAGQDVVTVFGNKNTVKTGEDDDYLRIMAHQGEVFAGAGNDFLLVDQEAKENNIKGDAGDDTFVLGGSNNNYYSGEGKDSFIISHNYQEAVIKDISSEDLLMFADVADSQLWFNRDQDNLLIHVQNTPNNEEEELTNSSLSIEDYFNNQQANIVLDTGLVSDSGETAYEILTQEGLLDLIDTMSNYDVLGSGDAFLSNVSDEDIEKLAIAWNDTSIV